MNGRREQVQRSIKQFLLVWFACIADGNHGKNYEGKSCFSLSEKTQKNVRLLRETLECLKTLMEEKVTEGCDKLNDL